jgi:hypothetical protein
MIDFTVPALYTPRFPKFRFRPDLLTGGQVASAVSGTPGAQRLGMIDQIRTFTLILREFFLARLLRIKHYSCKVACRGWLRGRMHQD